jgi:ribosomal protein S6--L-glutamate ligase
MIYVLADSESWHYRDLLRAAGKEHVIESLPFECLSAVVGGSSKILPAAAPKASDCVYARAMPAGSLQQVVFRMDVLLEWERAGVKIINSPRAIETSVDKYLALTKLAAAGVPVPRTTVAQSVQMALEQFDWLGGTTVLKPLFGSMGRGLMKILNAKEANDIFNELCGDGHVIYQQAYIDHGGEDLRLLVIGDEVLAMKRSNSQHWITNISNGGVGSPHIATAAESKIALQAAQAVGARIAGIDLLYDSHGKPYVIEVNSAPSWKATGEVLGIDIAKRVLDELSR